MLQLVSSDDPEAYAAARAEVNKRTGGLLARIFGRRVHATGTDDAPPLELAGDEAVVADLDKAWHGLHYLLTRAEWEGDPPMDFLAAGGREIGDVDVGYGPARAILPAELKTIALRLANFSDEELRARFNPADMIAKKIYPDIRWDDPADDHAVEYLMEHLATLREGVAAAASRGYGLVLVLR